MRLGRRATAVVVVSVAAVLVAVVLTVRLVHRGEIQAIPSPGSTSSSLSPSLPPGVPTLRFDGSGLEGGGFENVVAIDPSGSGTVLAGGDVSGFERSTDWGATWKTANRGLSTQSELRVAAIAFSQTNPRKVYAGVGWRGRLGGLLVSTDGGESWSRRSDVPGFSGIAHPRVPGLEPPFPRSTGNLLALNEKAGLIYAATYDKGVMRSSDDGKTWTSLGLDGKFLRSIVLDPSNPDTVYVVALGDGIYKTTTASTSGTFSRLNQAPSTPVQLAQIGGELYVAAGKEGIWRSEDGGGTWSAVGVGSIPLNGPFWRSIAGYQACGSKLIFIGSDKGGGRFSIMRSPDGGRTWSAVAANSRNLSTQVGGSSGAGWWLARRPEFMLGGKAYSAASIAVAPSSEAGSCSNRRVFVAGRSGVWQSTDAGVKWFPAVGNMGVTVVRAVAVDPHEAGRVYVAVGDWTVLESLNGGRTFANNRPRGGDRGYSIALDTSATPARVYLGVDPKPGDGKGELSSSPNPASGAPWSSEGLRAASGGGVPAAISIQHSDSSPVILVAVGKSGIWRKTSGTWANVNDRVMGRSVQGAAFASLEGSATVYFYDPGTGVWRSDDAGQTWRSIWAPPAGGTNQPGSLAVDPRDASSLYVSIWQTGIYRLDNAGSDTKPRASRLGSSLRGGPIAVDARGGIFLSQAATTKEPPALMYSGDRGSTWHDIATDDYRASAFAPVALAVDPQGRIYVGLDGNGLLIGTPGR